ncbi:KR domain-containing protein, partial [Streptomyces sp. HNM0575]|uniref:beta-ketoacyl reductase n=1 Tax=Streptomyces sp. HNM0575 TaxID=2716338 RepID=UPI00145F3317
GLAVPVLRKGRGEETALLTALARLHVAGHRVEWAPVFEGTGAVRVDLPTYPFQHERYWPTASVKADEAGSHPVDAALWGLVESRDGDALARVLGVDASTASSMAWRLGEWRSRERVRSSTGGWSYREWWKPLTGLTSHTPSASAPTTVDVPPDSADADSAVSGVWLVVVPAGGGVPVGWVSSVVGLLGAGVVCLEVEEGVERAVLAARIGEALPSVQECAGVLSFLPVGDGGVGSLSSGAAGGSGVPGGLWGSAVLVQALGDAGVVGPVWGVTCGAVVAVPGDVVVHPVQAAVWGLGRVAALELPQRWGGLVDLPADPDSWGEEIGRSLSRLLASGAGEDQVAVRDTGIYGRRLVPTELSTVSESESVSASELSSVSESVSSESSSAASGWVPSGSVLVTGGTGALGARVARWLVERGAGHVVLTSRRGLDAPGAHELRDELVGLGARVTIAACDA